MPQRVRDIAVRGLVIGALYGTAGGAFALHEERTRQRSGTALLFAAMLTTWALWRVGAWLLTRRERNRRTAATSTLLQELDGRTVVAYTTRRTTRPVIERDVLPRFPGVVALCVGTNSAERDGRSVVPPEKGPWFWVLKHASASGSYPLWVHVRAGAVRGASIQGAVHALEKKFVEPEIAHRWIAEALESACRPGDDGFRVVDLDDVGMGAPPNRAHTFGMVVGSVLLGALGLWLAR